MRQLVVALACTWAVGCAFEVVEPPPPEEAAEPDPGDILAEGPTSDDCEIDEEELGINGLVVETDEQRVIFATWFRKNDDSGPPVGFVVAPLRGELRYRVKAGGQIFESTQVTWIHPDVGGGNGTPVISSIDFCAE